MYVKIYRELRGRYPECLCWSISWVYHNIWNEKCWI